MTWPPLRRRGFLLLFVGGSVSYAVLSIAALSFAQVGIAVPLWPAAGLAFALTYLRGAAALPGIALGSLAGNVIVLTGAGVDTTPLSSVSVAVAIGAATQAWLGAAAVRRFTSARTTLADPRDILLFLLLSGVAATLVNATVGTATQFVTGILSQDQLAASWLTWWVGDGLGVIVMGPICLMLIPDERKIWEGRRWKIALPSLAVAALLISAVVLTDRLGDSQVAGERTRYAEEAERELLGALQAHREVLEGIGGFVRASQSVEEEEFRTFTASPLTRFPAIQALSWNPVVAREELPAFESAQRRRPGRANFSVTERSADGTPAPVGPRAQYVVVQYIEPLATNTAALGFDIGSNPARIVAIERARDSGLPAATAPIDLVQEAGNQRGVLVLHPVYAGDQAPEDLLERRSRIRGYAVGVYRLGDLLTGVFDGPRWQESEFRLADVTDVGEPLLLAQSSPRTVVSVDLAQGARAPLVSQPYDIYGRQWVLEITPLTGPMANLGFGASPSVLVVALLGMFSLEALLLLLTGLEKQAKQEALDRSYEATHDALTGLLNRRGFIRRFEEITNRARHEPAGHILLYGDLDRFKYVNDTAGHEAGDAMLRLVADQLRGNVRGGDIVARLGGDEFAIILTDCPLDVAEASTESIVAAIDSARLQTPEGEFGVGISFGMARFGTDGALDPDAILREADRAAYASKLARSGPNRRV